MTEEYPSSLQSSPSAANHTDIGVSVGSRSNGSQGGYMTEFSEQLDEWISTARNWRDVANGPVINITLSVVQDAEVKTVIATLEGVKKMYEEMNDD